MFPFQPSGQRQPRDEEEVQRVHLGARHGAQIQHRFGKQTHWSHMLKVKILLFMKMTLNKISSVDLNKKLGCFEQNKQGFFDKHRLKNNKLF